MEAVGNKWESSSSIVGSAVDKSLLVTGGDVGGSCSSSKNHSLCGRKWDDDN
jgi:hypothetical protein